MAVCTKIYRKSKRVCAGALDRKIILSTRSIKAPTQDSVDFSESFSDPKTVWAMIDTVDGVVFFADTNTESAVTHDIYIRYRKGVTAELWITLLSVNGGDDDYFDILKVENFGERNRFLKLRCNIRGKDTLPVNEA